MCVRVYASEEAVPPFLSEKYLISPRFYPEALAHHYRLRLAAYVGKRWEMDRYELQEG
jgi:hypothetical protein